MRTEWWMQNHAISNKKLKNIKGKQKSLNFWCTIWDHPQTSSSQTTSNNTSKVSNKLGEAINFKILHYQSWSNFLRAAR